MEVAHLLYHFQRGGDNISSQVSWLGIVSTPIAVLAIFLTLVGFRYAPHLATAFGTAYGIGVAIVHLLPHWSAFSDPFSTNGASPIAYMVIFSQIVIAVLFGAAGLYALLGERRKGPSGGNSHAAQSFR